MFADSHYAYCEKHLPAFFTAVGLSADDADGLLVGHGDKFYQYERQFEAMGLHFYHGVAIGLLTYFRPFRDEVRVNGNILMSIPDWVAKHKDEFLPLLPPAVAH